MSGVPATAKSLLTTLVNQGVLSQGLVDIALKVFQPSELSRNGLSVLLISALLSSTTSLVPFLVRIVKSFVMTRIRGFKKNLLCKCIVKDQDIAYSWITSFILSHPKYQNTASFELTSKAKYWHKGTDDEDEDEVEEEKSLESMIKDSKKKSSKDNFYFTASEDEPLHFVFEGTHFWASRHTIDENRSGSRQSSYIVLSYASLSREPLRKLVIHAQEHCKAVQSKTISCYRFDGHGHWSHGRSISKRSISSIHLPDKKKEEILEDARAFLSKQGKARYRDREIPWRRGYLLHGPPGTGKSTLCRVIASELNLPIYELTLNSKSLDDSGFVSAMTNLSKRAMVLIEDVDAAFVQRVSGHGASGSNVSFSALLNGIDGIGASEGRLLFLTTNHRDKLDDALTRCGRVDREVEFFHATKEQAKEMFLRFFMPKGKAITETQDQADVFAQSFTADQVSLSSLQGFLMEYREDASKALANIETWCEEQKKIRNKVVS